MSLQSQTKKARNYAAEFLHKAANMQKYFPDSEQDNLQGFLHHPAGFPIDCKRIRFGFRRSLREALNTQEGSMGLIFESEKYIKPGTLLEINIPLRGEAQKFTGKVVLVKLLDESYEIGLWLSSDTDVARIRIVEQICHIETYLKHKHMKDGPFISREKVTEEWITRFAASFPTLSPR